MNDAMRIFPGPYPNIGWDAQADRASLEGARALGRRALAGDQRAMAELFATPVGLKLWLDELAGRREGEAALSESASSAARIRGYGAGGRGAERFRERGLALDPEALRRQYAGLATASRPNFKSDVQSIERAILAGATEALREILDRSPMALWAMDFSLSEYESENVLAFCAKYAPAGPDVEMAAMLLGMGATLHAGRVALVVGEAMSAAGVGEAKSPRLMARALARCGYQFGYADALALWQRSRHERALDGTRPAVVDQKITWLGLLEEMGVEVGGTFSAEELAVHCAELPQEPGGAQRVEQFLAWAARGGAGLGAWVGLEMSPMRELAAWERLGPWLARRGLAVEAHRAAAGTGAMLSQERSLPYAEAQAIEAAARAPAKLGAPRAELRL